MNSGILITSANLYQIIGAVFILMLFILFREGFNMRERITPDVDYAEGWHKIGWWLRAMVFIIVQLITKEIGVREQIIYGLATLITLWPLYNLACNIGLRRKWYYVGKKGIDWVIRKIFYKVNFDK